MSKGSLCPSLPGTRVTDAVAQTPAAAPAPPVVAEASRTQLPSPRQRRQPWCTGLTRSVDGQISATEERAKNDAFLVLVHDVREWLDPEVPQSWTPPAQVLREMVRKTEIKTVPREYGPMYMAELTYDSAPSRAQFADRNL